MPSGVPQNRGSKSDGVPLASQVVGDTERRGTEVHFMAETDDLRQCRISLRDSGQAAARTVVPQQRRADPLASTSAAARKKISRIAGGVKGFVEYINSNKAVAAPEHFPRRRREGRHHRRSRDAVERQLPRKRAVLHQQHSAARRRHALDRFACGDDARDQQVHRGSRTGQESQGRDHRRRHARRAHVRAVGQGAGAEVQLADQGQAGVARKCSASVRGVVAAKLAEFLLEKPGRRQDHLAARSSMRRGRGKRLARRAK